MENTGKIIFGSESPEWFVAVGQNWIGPMTVAELFEKVSSLEISWAHFGWKKGQVNWQRLCDISQLKTYVPKNPGASLQKEIKQSATSSATSGRPVTRAATRKVKPKTWFLYHNESQYGPFSIEEISRAVQLGKITSRTHVWCQGMATWERMERVPAFGEYLGSHAPSAGKGKASARTEKRSAPREPLIAKVMMSDEQTVILGVCRDISIGGLQVLTDRVPGPAGSKLKMNISASTPENVIKPFVAEGVVVRILEDGRGFSFRFKHLSEFARKSVEEYIDSVE